MYPISWVTLLILPILVVGFGLIGSAVRFFWRRAFHLAYSPPVDWSGAAIRGVESVAVGVALVPLLYLLATLVDLSLWAGLPLVLLGVAAATFVYRLYRGEHLGWLRRLGRLTDRRVLLGLSAVLVLVVLERLIPYGSMLVYDGNDIRVYTLITQLIVAHGHYAGSFDPFTAANWNPTSPPHLTFSGSEAVFAFLNGWVPWNTPQLVSAAVLSFSILIPFSAYALLRTVFSSRPASVALVAAAVFGVVSAYPLFFLDWGGIDETVVWFVFPIAVIYLLRGLAGGREGLRWVIGGGVILGGATIVSPFPLAYVGLFALGLALSHLLSRTITVRLLSRVLLFFGLALLLASPLIVHEATQWSQSLAASPPGYAGWGEFEANVILRPGDPIGSLWRLVTLDQGVLGPVFVFLAGTVGLSVFSRREIGARTLGFWTIGLLLLNSNGPFGLFLITYPGWTMLTPDRPADLLALPLSGGAGLLASALLERARRRTRPEPQPIPHPRRRPFRSLAPRVAAVLVVLFSVTGAAATYQVASLNGSTVAWGQTLTGADVAAFDWMQTHVPENATVLVNPSDSGTWIPEFTGLRVFPYPELISSPAIYNESQQIPALFNTTQYAPTLTFLSEFNLTYAYFGAKEGYSVSAGLTLNELTLPQPATAFVKSASVCAVSQLGTTLSLQCNGDTVVLRGPVVVALAEYHNGLRVATTLVAIPANLTWTFTLQVKPGPPPNTWTASIAEVPISSYAYSQGNAVVLRFSPLFLSLATSQAVVTQAVGGLGSSG